MKNKGIIIGVILFILLTGGGYILFQGGFDNNLELQNSEDSNELDEWNKTEQESNQNAAENDLDSRDSNHIEEVEVYICGAVKNAGVYTLEEGMRLHDLLDLCGGALEDADLEAVNLARVVADGEKVYILNKKEAKKLNQNQETDKAAMTSKTDNRININTALKEALMTLPGIGEAKAESIINYRESIKPFEDISDIMKIEGIKEGIYNKLKDKITI